MQKRKPCSEETKQKISKALKGKFVGERNSNFGKRRSEESRKKMSESRKRALEDPELRKKIGDAQRGKVISEESRRKNSEAHRGEKHPNFGKHLSEETRKKIGDAQRGEKHHNFGKTTSQETRKKMSVSQTGRHHTEETRKQMSEKAKGRIISEEQRKKISESLKGNKNGVGKHPSEETRKKLVESHKGQIPTEESRRKRSISLKTTMADPAYRKRQSESHRGEKSYLWKGGISFGKYCVKFSRYLKKRVRDFFGNKCVECGKTREENGAELIVHHVNYDKMVCCNDVKPLFVALCRSCHGKTQSNRQYWEQHFTEVIMTKFNGQCYLSKEAV